MSTTGQRMAAAAALALAALPFALHCGHGQPRCEPARLRAPTPTLPADAATVGAVEGAGFRYEPCPTRPRYRLVRPGTRALTADEIRAVGHELLPETPGPSAVMMGSCACDLPKTPEERSALCVSVSLRAGDLDPGAIARLISRRVEALSLSAAAVTVRVDLHAKPGPRCLPEDPGCGPIPVARQCLADVGYVPERARLPVFEKWDGGDCAHDGECDSGAFPSCFSTRERDRTVAGDCFTPFGLKHDALCGCVAGQCIFFTQPR